MAAKFFSGKLEKRPILINHHLAYQDYMNITDDENNLETQYSEYLKQEPDNNVLHYLLGKVSDNACEYFTNSVKGSNPCEYGYYELGCLHLSNGNFEEAENNLKKAVNAMPENKLFEDALYEAQLAQGKYDLLLSDKKIQNIEYDYGEYEYIIKKISLYILKDDIDAAKQSIAEYKVLMETFWDGDEQDIFDETIAYLNGIIAYYTNDIQTYVSSLDEFEFNRRLIERKFDDIENNIEYSVETDSMSDNIFIYDYTKSSRRLADNGYGGMRYLLLYLEKNVFVSSYIEKAAKLYSCGDKVDSMIADYLLRKVPISVDELETMVLPIKEKCIVLAALGKANPTYRSELYELAKKLNYNKEFPYHIINEVISE